MASVYKITAKVNSDDIRALIMLSAVIPRLLVALADIAGVLFVMFIQECGHAFVGQRYGSELD